MKIKTAEATGLQLDWGVAVAMQIEKLELVEGRPVYMPSCGGRKPFNHTDPAVFVRLIKEYCIQLFPFYDFEDVRWDADIRPDVRIVNCDTPEQAVARCVIAMKLGDEFEVPDELGVVS